jgi:hypothetical protein
VNDVLTILYVWHNTPTQRPHMIRQLQQVFPVRIPSEQHCLRAFLPVRPDFHFPNDGVIFPRKYRH